MDSKTDNTFTKKLVLPTMLAVAVLASGCGSTTQPSDSGVNDTAVADADFDAGCVPPEQYDPVSRTCIPVV